MSQIRATTKDGKWAIYGLDHAIGYFISVIDESVDDESEAILVDRCTHGPFQNAHPAGICDLIEQHIPESEDRTRHISRIMGDLDPAE